MQEIQGQAKTVRQLLSQQKYAVDYYQREYKWEEKQIQELIEDLTTRFLDDYDPKHSPEQVADYGRYFLGSIIISNKLGTRYIVDGQQRLTSLTLLLIYLRNLQKGREDAVPVDDLIFSFVRQKRSFNIAVDERLPVLEALFNGQSFEGSNQSESVGNILARHQNIADSFPVELTDAALPFFIDWLIENVHLVEITAYSDDDAYTIFETMNDRGLSLSPTDMLKGFLLANITDTYKRTKANDLWKQRTQELRDIGKEVESDFFKAWLRSQYAMTVRDTSKNAKPGDFDRLGPEFHRWVREHADEKHDDLLVLRTSDEFFRFIERDFDFYARVYQQLVRASMEFVSGWEHVLYNAKQGFTLQYLVLLAPLTPDDDATTVKQKVRLTAMFLDIVLTRRAWNYHRNAYSPMYRPTFQTAKEIRGLDVQTLAQKLHGELYQREAARGTNNLAFNHWLTMHQQNRWTLHLILARMAEYVETGSGLPSRYLEYINAVGDQRYEVEHIWADHYRRHSDEYPDSGAFQSDRNKLGGLLLLPKKFNAAYRDKPYEAKLEQYQNQNLLAYSLHPNAYTMHSGFEQFRKATKLPFRPHDEFNKADLRERRGLYQQVGERIWDPDQLLREVGL